MKDIRLLTPDDIDVRIQSVNSGGARLLLYKNARVDMNILDETFGPMNWQRTHTRDNTNCIVSVWDSEKQEWVSKEDTGTDSNMDAQKGRASDSFKRACFNWGIGRELYTAPDMFIYSTDLKTFKQDGNRYVCYDEFVVTDIQYQGRAISSVTVSNLKNNKVTTFKHKTPKRQNANAPTTNPTPKDVKPTQPTDDRPITEAEISLIHKWAEKKGMNISIVLAMANVETLEGLTAEGYNRIVKVLREM